MAVRRMFSDLVLQYTNSGASDTTVGLFLTKLGHVVLTKATEFVVVDDFACSPSGDWGIQQFTGGIDIFMNIRLNTTMYFTEPDGSPSWGIRGLVNPYPDGNLVYKRFVFEPKVYVLPGQNWDMVLHHGVITFSAVPYPPIPVNTIYQILGMVIWTLYDGVDAVIANKLLELGLDIKPENIDWYKRQLIKQENSKEVK